MESLKCAYLLAGRDPLYKLTGIRGVWHEEILTDA
jgi:hypothetical protein